MRASPWRGAAGAVRRALLQMPGVERAEALAAGLDAEFVSAVRAEGLERAVERFEDRFPGRRRPDNGRELNGDDHR